MIGRWAKKLIYFFGKYYQSKYSKHNTMDIESIVNLVGRMKITEQKPKKTIIDEINNEILLTNKCVRARYGLAPQSTDMETIYKKDLQIGKPKNNTSGDGCKNNINYEIKSSLHAKKSALNFVQIRPDHDIDFYIFVAFNLHESGDEEGTGKAYIFKIPSDTVYKLVVQYGGYAHGTNSKLGKITYDNMKGKSCEYALRCNPNMTKGKSFKLWQELLKFEVTYDASNF